MKTRPYLILASIALTPTLLASPQPGPVERPAELELAAKLEQIVQADIKKDLGGGWCGVKDRRVTYPPVKELKEMAATEESIQSIINNDKAKETVDKLNAPIVIGSMEDALKHLTRASMEKIEVDFDKEQLAIFAWQGSPNDRVSGELHTNAGVVAKILYSRRHTEGLKTHSVIFSMPKGAEIKAIELGTRIHRCGLGGVKPIEPKKIEPKQVPDCDLRLAPLPHAEKLAPKGERHVEGPGFLQPAPKLEPKLKVAPRCEG